MVVVVVVVVVVGVVVLVVVDDDVVAPVVIIVVVVVVVVVVVGGGGGGGSGGDCCGCEDVKLSQFTAQNFLETPESTSWPSGLINVCRLGAESCILRVERDGLVADSLSIGFPDVWVSNCCFLLSSARHQTNCVERVSMPGISFFRCYPVHDRS